MTTPIAILASGGGRTLENLLAQIERGALDAEVVLVATSRPCGAAEIARRVGLPVSVAPPLATPADVEALVRGAGAAWVVLAGYTRLLPLPDALRGRVVNIHPALLPDFGGPGMYGLRVHRAVLDAGRRESGCTVHLADDAYDQGPILAQATCPVEPEDDPESLAARVFELERRLYPETLRALFASEPAEVRPCD